MFTSGEKGRDRHASEIRSNSCPGIHEKSAAPTFALLREHFGCSTIIHSPCHLLISKIPCCLRIHAPVSAADGAMQSHGLRLDEMDANQETRGQEKITKETRKLDVVTTNMILIASTAHSVALVMFLLRHTCSLLSLSFWGSCFTLITFACDNNAL